MTSRPDSERLQDMVAEFEHRLAELSVLHEFSRALLGAHDRDQVGSRAVLSVMGALGARSGALFAADERGRYRVIAARGIEDGAESLRIPDTAREWMLRTGGFALATAAAARALGELRDRLVNDWDAVVAVAVADRQGMGALLVFGPRVFEHDYDEDDLRRLEALASLAGLALGLHEARAGRERAAKSGGAGASRRPARSLAALRQAHPALRTMVGESAALLQTAEDLLAVARTRFPVTLTGESGVGKELAARAVHALSDRAAGPFEVVDCGSIPRELIESELFGHVRGSFTGAHRDRRGAFEIAHRGTLFLDEIGEMPLQLQTRLLRVLQEGRFRRVGDEELIEVDVRVVAASNRDLKSEVAAKRFREDLFYRLSVFAIHVAPLRERLEDLGSLTRHFLAQQGRDLEVDDWDVDADVLTALEAHAFPGNLRELSNLCAALTVRCREDGHVALEDLAHVWKRQHPGEPAPWSGGSGEPPGRLGSWVLEQARAARFNLIELARDLQRRKRAGRRVPLTERSALSYYVSGEILRALAEAGGDAEAAARAVAGDPALEARVLSRVHRVCELLRASSGGPETLRRRFGKLPAGYEDALESAHRAVKGS